MPSPFPGMDPYLEGSSWDSFHAAFISELGRQLSLRLRPHHIVRVERRTEDTSDESDDSLLHRAAPRRLAIRNIPRRDVVTRIELLCPADKQTGTREDHLERRAK